MVAAFDTGSVGRRSVVRREGHTASPIPGQRWDICAQGERQVNVAEAFTQILLVQNLDIGQMGLERFEQDVR